MNEEKIEEIKKELQTMTDVAKDNQNLLFAAIRRIIELENERSDGGIITIKNNSCYKDIVNILAFNGYFVTVHINDDNTISLEFWRA